MVTDVVITDVVTTGVSTSTTDVITTDVITTDVITTDVGAAKVVMPVVDAPSVALSRVSKEEYKRLNRQEKQKVKDSLKQKREEYRQERRDRLEEHRQQKRDHPRGAVVKDIIGQQQCESSFVDGEEVLNISSADDLSLCTISPLRSSLTSATTTPFPSVSNSFTTSVPSTSRFTFTQSTPNLPTTSKSISTSTSKSISTYKVRILSNQVSSRPQIISASEVDNIRSSFQQFSKNCLLHVQNRMRTNVVTVLKECETELKSCIGFLETHVNVLNSVINTTPFTDWGFISERIAVLDSIHKCASSIAYVISSAERKLDEC
ncbi:hypothetical protein QE152_g40176 [Popillia japonica]|uniref:Uncharacterized protein n=1 Tax=Popillia japonica TaxID=7064 RepID=A0AAW1HRV1_POPJA